jgi:hypothetical protein
MSNRNAWLNLQETAKSLFQRLSGSLCCGAIHRVAVRNLGTRPREHFKSSSHRNSKSRVPLASWFSILLPVVSCVSESPDTSYSR